MIERRKKANKLKKLSSQIEQDFDTTLSLVENVNEFKNNINKRTGEINANVYAVALSLQHFYTSLETTFKRIAKEIDGDLPEGEKWHFELLEQMTISIKDVRPALLNKEEKKKLDKLRRFRHVVRHGYEYELDWEQIKPLAEDMNEVILSLKNSFADFESFLIDLAEEIMQD